MCKKTQMVSTDKRHGPMDYAWEELATTRNFQMHAKENERRVAAKELAAFYGERSSKSRNDTVSRACSKNVRQ